MGKVKAKGWTIEEENKVRAILANGTTADIGNLAKKLGRNFDSVYSKFWRFKKGLKRRFPKESGKEWVKTVVGFKKSPKKLKKVVSGVSKRVGRKPVTAPPEMTLPHKKSGLVITKNSIFVRDFKEIHMTPNGVEISL